MNILSDLVDYLGKIKISETPVNTLQQAFYNGENKYIFYASNSGIIDVERTYTNGLSAAVNDTSASVSYKLFYDDTIFLLHCG